MKSVMYFRRLVFFHGEVNDVSLEECMGGRAF